MSATAENREVTPDNPLIIGDTGPFDFDTVTIEGGQILINTNGTIKIVTLRKQS